MRVSEKTSENSEQLCQEVGPEFELANYYLPGLRAESLGHWWGNNVWNRRNLSLFILIFS